MSSPVRGADFSLHATSHDAAARSSAYALSPMQGGMLFQNLLSEGTAERSGYDIGQIHVLLNEALDAAVLARAFTHVARRHAILSTSFRWEGVERPEQRPAEDVTVAVDSVDWRRASESELPALRSDFLARDRVRSFDLRRAPLMRATVCTLANAERCELFWTFHHILLDGRSFATVLVEVFQSYAALRRGEEPALPLPTRPYADYIAWLARRDASASRAFFKTFLKGKSAPTPLPCSEPAARPLPRRGCGTASQQQPAQTAHALREFARAQQTTVGGLVQAAWGLLLSRLSGDDDVVFGVIRSSRRSALDGEAEAMVGLFINSPLRVRVDERESISDLLAGLRAVDRAARPTIKPRWSTFKAKASCRAASPCSRRCRCTRKSMSPPQLAQQRSELAGLPRPHVVRSNPRRLVDRRGRRRRLRDQSPVRPQALSRRRRRAHRGLLGDHARSAHARAARRRHRCAARRRTRAHLVRVERHAPRVFEPSAHP